MVSSHMVRGVRVIFTDGWSIKEKRNALENILDLLPDLHNIAKLTGHAWVRDPGMGVEGWEATRPARLLVPERSVGW